MIKRTSAIVSRRILHFEFGISAAVFAFGMSLVASATTITLSGNRILKDGSFFVPNGYIVEAFVTPKAQLQALTNSADPDVVANVTRSLLAQDFYLKTGEFAEGGSYATNKTALQVVKEWGANTVRFNLNQSALDPQSSSYSTQYLSTVTDVVQRARATNLVVIIAMFTSCNVNLPTEIRDQNPPRPLATPTTLRAFLNLEQYFGNDQGIMFEWLNENYPPCSMPEAWDLWSDGGYVSWTGSPWYGIQFTGVNEMLSDMRTAGSQNPIIVQGLGASYQQGYTPFEGIPTISDPSNKLIYAYHPFFNADPDQMDWDGVFGDFATNKAFIVTAWGALSTTNEGWCPIYGVDTPSLFMEYLDTRDIGLMGYAVDVPYSMINHFTNSVITVKYFATNCTEWGSAGSVMTNYVMSSQIDLISSSVNNGGFESGTDSSFAGTANWYNGDMVGGDSAVCRLSTTQNVNAVCTGTYGGWLKKTSTTTVTPTQDTGYIIQAGDVYTMTLDARPGYLFNVSTDKVRFNLFTTNDVGGFTWVTNYDAPITQSGWHTYTFTSAAVTNAAVIGRNLYVRLYGIESSGAMVFVDNIAVSVAVDYDYVP